MRNYDKAFLFAVIPPRPAALPSEDVITVDDSPALLASSGGRVIARISSWEPEPTLSIAAKLGGRGGSISAACATRVVRILLDIAMAVTCVHKKELLEMAGARITVSDAENVLRVVGVARIGVARALGPSRPVAVDTPVSTPAGDDDGVGDKQIPSQIEDTLKRPPPWGLPAITQSMLTGPYAV